MHLAEDQVDDLGQGTALAGDRDPERLHALPEDRLALGERRRVVGALGVELDHDDRARRPGERALVPQRPRARVDTVGGRDDEEGGVHGAQGRADLADEVGVAGCVEQGERQVGAGQSCGRGDERAGAIDLVGGRAHAGEDLEEAGLAGTRRTHQCDVAQLVGPFDDRHLM